MAKSTIPVNYLDDILSASMNGKRKWKLTDNGDGTVTLEDVSEYDQVGSVFGAGALNTLGQAVNDSVDKSKVLNTLEENAASTDDENVAGSKALAELNKKTDTIKTYVGSDGKLHFVDASGADTVIPFSSGGVNLLWSRAHAIGDADSGQTINLDLSDYDYVVVAAAMTSGSSSALSFFISINDSVTLYLVNFDGNVLAQRDVSVSENGVTFGAGKNYNLSNKTNVTDGRYAYPYEIYGVK